MAEEEDHDEHDHRRAHRRLLETAAEEDHSEHNHGEEELQTESAQDPMTSASSGQEDDHSGLDHDEEEHEDEEVMSMTFLNTESLAAAGVAGETERETVERALAFITACQIDPNCALESATEVESEPDLNRHANLGLKIGLAMSFIAMTVIASYIPSLFMGLPLYNGLLTCLNAFSGAVFLTVGLTHLLPHVAEYEAAANLDTDYPVGLAIVAVGFILILFVEQILFNVHGHRHEVTFDELRSQDIPLLERTKGVAVFYQEPLITQISRKDVLVLYAAICAHKMFTAMSLATRFLRLGCPIKLLTILLLPFHLLPPLAVVLAASIGSDSPLASLIMVGLATGTFLYVGAFEVVCEEFAEHEEHEQRVVRKVEPTTDSISMPTPPPGLRSSDGQMITSEADVKEHGPEEWRPSKLIKFGMFTLGCGLLLAITAGLPKHEH